MNQFLVSDIFQDMLPMDACGNFFQTNYDTHPFSTKKLKLKWIISNSISTKIDPNKQNNLTDHSESLNLE